VVSPDDIMICLSSDLAILRANGLAPPWMRQLPNGVSADEKLVLKKKPFCGGLRITACSWHRWREDFFDLWVGRLSSVSTDPGFYDEVVSQRDRMAVRKISWNWSYIIDDRFVLKPGWPWVLKVLKSWSGGWADMRWSFVWPVLKLFGCLTRSSSRRR